MREFALRPMGGFLLFWTKTVLVGKIYTYEHNHFNYCTGMINTRPVLLVGWLIVMSFGNSFN